MMTRTTSLSCRHSRESGNLGCKPGTRKKLKAWIFAFAGMTILLLVVSPSFASKIETRTPEDALLSKAFSAYMDGRDKQALSFFEEVVRINPKNEAARKGLDKVKGRMKKAADIETSKAKKLAEAKYREGRAFEHSGDLVGAIDSYHDALDASSTFSSAKSRLSHIKADVTKEVSKKQLNLTRWAFNRGTLAYLDRDWAKAYRIWSERSQIEPTNVVLANATARAENNFQKMMLAEREEFFRRGGRAFYEQGLYKEAQDSWEKVLALREEDQEALEGKARAEDAILRAQGQNRDSRIHELLEQALDYYADQSWRKSLDLFTQISQMDPEFSTAKEYIAKLNQRLDSVVYNPTVGGGESWRPSQTSTPGESSLALPSKTGNLNQSRKELESQLKRDPSNIRTQQELDRISKQQDDESERLYKDGLIAYSQGNRVQAIQLWKQVLIVNPDHKKGSAALKKAMAEEEREDSSGAPK